MRSKGMRLLAVAFVMLFVGAMSLQQSARAAEFEVTATVITCSELPEFGPYPASPLCDLADGVVLDFADANGVVQSDCTTVNGACSYSVPFDSTNMFILDESTIPAGYYLYSDNPQTFEAPSGPPDGVVGFPLFVLLPVDAAFDTYGVNAAVAYCDADPRIQGNSWLDLCVGAAGARITFSDEQGNVIEECEAVYGIIEGGGQAGVCGIQAPLGSTTTVTLDESSIDPAYMLISDNPQYMELPSTPPDGVMGIPIFILVPVDGNTNENPPVNNGSNANANLHADGLAVVLYEGDCDNLGAAVAELNDVAPEVGEPVGDQGALTAAMGVAIGAQFFLDEAIDGGYALVVYSDLTTDSAAACGEIGGVNNHDGVLPIRLRNVGDPGLAGVATFAYNAANETTTDVTVIVTEP
ncbi:hypothetical protein BH09CHL1_BH09CHL1_22720 [soil metagenome]